MSFEDEIKKAIEIATNPNGRCKVSSEEIRKRMKLLRIAKELKQHCSESDCTTCIFSRPNGDCDLSPEIPANWKLL